MKLIPQKPIFKKVGYQSGVIGVLTVPLHPKPIGKTWKLENCDENLCWYSLKQLVNRDQNYNNVDFLNNW